MKKHVSAIGWGFATKGITFLLFYALQIFLVRKLPVSVYGVWSLFYSAFIVSLFISECGINSSARKYIAEHAETGCAGAVMSASFRLRLAASAIFGAAIALAAHPLAALLGHEELAPLFRVAGPMLFLAGIVEYYKSVFIGMRRINLNFWLNAAEHGAKLALGAAAVYMAVKLPLGLAGSFTAALAVAATAGFFMERAVEHPSADGLPPKMEGRLMRYALPLFIYSALVTAMLEADTLILGALKGAEAAGLYNAAKQIVAKGPHIAVAIGMGVMPAFARLAAHNRDEMRRLFNQLMLLNTAVIGTVALVIALFGDKILLILYGAKCLPAAPAFRMLSVFLLAASYATFLVNFLEYQGKAWRIAFNITVALGIDAAMLAVLAPRLGGLGAAMSLSAGFAVFAALCWRDVKKSLEA
ncbi:MAG: oligosaccharide flippase family protein [Elusimicrobiales bacterium]